MLKKRRVGCFDALRFILACSIFLNHCTFLKSTSTGDWVFENLLHNGRYAVTVFFVLSGFCMYEGYADRINNISYIEFIKKRLCKFWPLYMASMAWVALYYLLTGKKSIIGILGELLLSATMMQTMTVKYWGILNSAAWFMSSLFFLYLLTPAMIRLVNKIKRIRLTIVGSFLAILFYEVIMMSLMHLNIISPDIRNLLTYVYPIYWIPVFFIGILLAKLKEKSEEWTINGTLLEVITLLVCVSVYMLGLHGNRLLVDYKSLYYGMSAALLVYIFSFERGALSNKLCTSRFFKNSLISGGGNVCTEIYLFHFPIINYGGIQIINRFLPGANGVIKIVILFGVTLLWALFARKCISMIKQK